MEKASLRKKSDTFRIFVGVIFLDLQKHSFVLNCPSMKKILFLTLFITTIALSAQSTASENVSTFEIDAPQLDTHRKIWVYTPKGYDSANKKFPVIYMHDAQNLFDASTSYAGEWKVDEILDSLKQPEVIIVGIEHGNDKRIEELTPYPHEKYGGGKGDKYLDFIVETLKPHVDVAYPTLSDKEHTAIMGSSLGGLISFYAAFKYPETFGKAGVFSPSFWFSEQIFEFVQESEIENSTKFYFTAGTGEGEEMVPDLEKMIALLKEKGLSEDNMHVKIVENGQHNEAAWNQEFPEAFLWLMKPETSKVIFKIAN